MRRNETPMEKESLLALGQKIALLRKKAGLTQLTLSLETGISKTHINDIEKGRRNPSYLTLLRIATGLGVSVKDLLP